MKWKLQTEKNILKREAYQVAESHYNIKLLNKVFTLMKVQSIKQQMNRLAMNISNEFYETYLKAKFYTRWRKLTDKNIHLKVYFVLFFLTFNRVYYYHLHMHQKIQ